MDLSGPVIRGELKRDGNRHIGELRHGNYRYRVTGEWSEDREGRVLKCIVLDAP